MNREIKFRAWSNGQMKDINFPECLHYSDDRLTYWDDYGHSGDASAIIMQYTGLQDKNAKDIYEGDIVRFPELYETPEMTSTKYTMGEVFFDFGAWQIRCKGQVVSGDDYTLFQEMKAYDENFEILGNIYEHPNLLKQ